MLETNLPAQNVVGKQDNKKLSKLGNGASVMDREVLLDYIIDHADMAWAYDFLYNVLGIDWTAKLKGFPDETLLGWARELGYIKPKEDY